MMPESKNFDNNLSLSIYYASFQLKKNFLPGQRFCPRQIATVKGNIVEKMKFRKKFLKIRVFELISKFVFLAFKLCF